MAPMMDNIPRSEQFDDIYFAVEDGLAESRYVFLDRNNLPDGWARGTRAHDRFVIAETGFGTGLNFLCAWDLFDRTAEPQQKLHYYSFEKFPLSAADIEKYLGHWRGEFGDKLDRLTADYPLRVGGWHTLRLDARVTLTLIFDDVNRAIPELSTPVDCWFLDGHAPAKNPDMWSDTVFRNIGRLSHQGTRFATFTAAGFVRRALQDVGFTVSKTRGFGRKRDMTIGVYEGENAAVLTSVPPSVASPQNIAVIGGGIAGASLCHALTSRGCTVTLFEKNGLASGGSGNFRGLSNPRITALRGPEAEFYAAGFALAQRMFQKISRTENIGYDPCGTLHLITDDTKHKRFTSCCTTWGWHPDHARLVSADDASTLAGVPLTYPALYLADAAMVSPKLVTQSLAQPARLVPEDIEVITRTESGWSVNGNIYDAVVLAGGVDVTKFSQTAHLPLQKIRGQVTLVRPNELHSRLKTNLCYGGYCARVADDSAVIGSTFQHWITDDSLRTDDDTDNVQKLSAVVPDMAVGADIIGARASFRCAAKDRIPVIGELAGHKGLYISTAHGSHGIVSSVIAAEYLAAQICGEPQILPESLEAFLSPSRFGTLLQS